MNPAISSSKRASARAVGSGFKVHCHFDEADLLHRLGAGRDRDGKLLAAHQRIVKPRAGKAAEHAHTGFKRDRIGIGKSGASPVAGDPRHRHGIDHFALHAGRQGVWASDHRTHIGPARDRAEMLLDHRPGGGQVDIAGQHQHRVVGPVVIAEPLADIVQRGGIEIGHRTDRRMAIGVADGEQAFGGGIAHQAIGLVVALALLVLDNAALLVELVLGQRAQQVAHAVALHEQRQIERALGHGHDIIGAIKESGAIAG